MLMKTFRATVLSVWEGEREVGEVIVGDDRTKVLDPVADPFLIFKESEQFLFLSSRLQWLCCRLNPLIDLVLDVFRPHEVGRDHATLKTLCRVVTPERIAFTVLPVVTASTEHGKILAFRISIKTVEFSEIDEIGLILVIVVKNPPECRKTLLTVKQVLIDATIRSGSGHEVPGDELLVVPYFQNECNAQGKVMNDRLHQAADALPVPCFESLEPR